ncbi:nucleotidyltransferase family protein [Methylobacterium brachiatum]|jgi:hypothetical protein|uniref:nucleotidyltransferase family protein n=1 Tax=Methylobacterium brachiatum TaxID=269660 RepID=UPI0006ADCEB7|nr:GSU2403 family nucleotidyltransferase fold protein [Methylobacterium brachiatum]AYO86505.1 hypothetical protein EBB05_29515 [Methylobacterium brachiatum]KOX59599.1 hypothetical protein ADL19_05000 [Streptomyces purpurogeneiscleroticus]
MREIDLAYRTLYAELCQRSLDGAFEADFPIAGRFVTVPVNGRAYWYFDLPGPDGVKRRYVGPKHDAQITDRVERFQAIKGDLKARRKLVSTLVREAGLPAPERFSGDVVRALSEAGLFRLRGVLVGTVAFQCYPGILGARLPNAALQTGDADFAQFHSVSAAVDDSLPPMLDVLRSVDTTFRDLPHQADGRRSTKFRNAKGYEVEFLTPNRGSADHDGKPAGMPALGGAAAHPLRFLDFLIHEPVRAVLLYGGGVNVVVPAPERFAVHKLIVASRRRDDPLGRLKRDKDALQAAVLGQALAMTRRASDLATAYAEAWGRGPAWRQALREGLASVPTKARTGLVAGIVDGLTEIGEDPEGLGFDAPGKPRP